MVEKALQLIQQHGYLALLLLQALGVLALPLPDEMLVAFAGYLCYRGVLHLGPTIATAFLGASLGITLSYLLGRVVGPHVNHRLERWLHLSTQRQEQGRRWIAGAGKWSLTFGYFIPGVRHLIGFTAGTVKLPLRVFWLYAGIGALVWSSVFASLGFVLGEQWSSWAQSIPRALLLLALLVAVAAGMTLWLRRRPCRSGDLRP